MNAVQKRISEHQRSLESGLAILSFVLGCTTLSTYLIMGLDMFYWTHTLIRSTLVISSALIIAALLVWAGVRLNGRWHYSPFLRLVGLGIALGIYVLLALAKPSSSATITYGFITIVHIRIAAGTIRDARART